MLAVRIRSIDGKGLSPTRFAALPAATGTFTSRLPTGWSPSPPLDMTTTSTGPPMSAGLAPAGMAASFAALAHQAAGHGILRVWEHRGQPMAGRQRRELFRAPAVEGTGADQDRT